MTSIYNLSLKHCRILLNLPLSASFLSRKEMCGELLKLSPRFLHHFVCAKMLCILEPIGLLRWIIFTLVSYSTKPLASGSQSEGRDSEGVQNIFFFFFFICDTVGNYTNLICVCVYVHIYTYIYSMSLFLKQKFLLMYVKRNIYTYLHI